MLTTTWFTRNPNGTINEFVLMAEGIEAEIDNDLGLRVTGFGICFETVLKVYGHAKKIWPGRYCKIGGEELTYFEVHLSDDDFLTVSVGKNVFDSTVRVVKSEPMDIYVETYCGIGELSDIETAILEKGRTQPPEINVYVKAGSGYIEIESY